MATALAAFGLATAGLFLSAFFSGSETGFYRVARVRLLLDGLGGDVIARGLLWLTNHPSLFVATTLVGTNLANYITSLAIVVGTQALVGGDGHVAELLAPLLLAPALFVYGELLPKNVFLKAPNRLLRSGGPLFLMFVGLFLPVSVLLCLLNRFLARLVAESPEQVQLTLARRELQRVLEEGREAGILHDAQQLLARAIFNLAKQPAARFATPLRDVPRARFNMTAAAVLRLARRYRIAAVAVEDGRRRLTGYVRVIDLVLAPGNELGPVRPLLEIREDDTYVTALARMQSTKESLAQVVDAGGQMTGILTIGSLREPLLQGRRPGS